MRSAASFLVTTLAVWLVLSGVSSANLAAGELERQGPAGAFLVGGRPMRRAIVVSTAETRQWAKELSRICERATGQPLLAEAAPQADDLVIHVGLTDYVQSKNLDFAGLHPFGYFLKLADGNRLILCGKTRQATGYAVYDFAKRFLGYRSFMPGELGELVDKTAAVVLPESLNLREEPDILSYTVAWGHRDAFERSSRTTLLASHWLMRIYPPAKYAQQHPEYYPVVDGQRFVPPPTMGGTWQPCVSNPDLPAIAAEYARGWFRDRPAALGLSVGVNDGGGDCQCEKCLAWRGQFGNQYIPFYNAVAEATAREFPDKLVCFIAYGRGASPVPHGIALHPNLQVEVCQGLKNDFELLRAWKQAGAANLGLYEYMYGGGYVVPRHYPRIAAGAWRRACQDFGLKSIWQELYPDVWLYDGARQYVLNELAWDTGADVDALLDDYFTRMYAEAAQPMRQFFDRVEAVYGRKKDPLNFNADSQRLNQLEEYQWDDLAYLQQRLAEARAAVREPEAGRRLALFERIFGLSTLYLESYLCGKDLRDCLSIRDEQEIKKLTDTAARGLRAAGAIDAYTMPADEEQQIFAGKASLDAYRNLPTVKPGPFVEQQADRAFEKITEFLLAKGDWPSVREFWKRTAAGAADPRFQALALTQVYVRESPEAGVNLVKSPGFEPVAGKGRGDAPAGEPQRRGWGKSLPEIPGWSTWHFQQSVTRFYLDAEEAHGGSHSASIGENQISGCFQTSVPVTPGCRYRVSFWVKQTPPDQGGSLSVRWMKQGGAWADEGEKAVPRLSIPYPQESTSDWRRVSTTFTAVEPCTSCLLLFGAPRQGPDEAVWLDDIEMVKIYDPS